MGNTIDSFISGFAKSIGTLFSSPLDFLSGKHCSSICGSTWDFICYIHHFCVANLLKLGLIILVFYIALFVLYKMRIFHCLFHTLFKASRACFAMWFYVWLRLCHFLCHTLPSSGRRRHLSMMSNEDATTIKEFSENKDEIREGSCFHTSVGSEMHMNKRMGPHRCRKHRRSHFIRRSLRPRNHRVQVEISQLGGLHPRKHRRRDEFISNVHHLRVSHTSKFANKRNKSGI